MGLFDRWKAKKEIKKAREEAKANPTPKTTVNFSDKLVEFGEYDNALAVLEMGAKAFPDSDLLQTKYKQLKKLKYQDQIKNLKRATEQGNDPVAFAKLGDIYIKIGEEDKAIEICQIGSEKFPDYEGNHLILGKLRWDRFRDNLIAKDGVKAVEHFEQAVRLNPNNYKILFQLARIFVEIGAPQRALEKIEKIFEIYPNDENANRLKRRAQMLPEVRETDLEDLFKRFKEKNPNLKNQTTSTLGTEIVQKIKQDQQFLQQKISSLLQMEGLQAFLLYDDESNLLFEKIDVPEWKGSLENGLTRVVRAAQKCSLRMDIGALQDSRIEGKKGWMFLREFVNVIFVFVFTKKARFRKVSAELADFFEFKIYQ